MGMALPNWRTEMKYPFSSQKLGDKVVRIASVRAEDQVMFPSPCWGV